MDFLPLFIKLTGRNCLVVGGGEIALRKAELLLQAGAKLTIIAQEVHPRFSQLQEKNVVEILQRPYCQGDEQGKFLVIVATDNKQINTEIYTACEQKNILVNVVDAPENCRFIVPAIIDRSPLMLAIATAGHAPMLAKALRARIEAWLPHGYDMLIDVIDHTRQAVKTHFSGNRQAIRRFWEKMLESDIAEQAIAGNTQEAEKTILNQLLTHDPLQMGEGVVYLVGAGPGNPDLLTFRALRLMQRADVVLYDNLVSPAIVELVRRDAERIYVGKKASNHPLPQEEINQLMVTLAKAGKAVLRLKGGDPFIFGRGGEEIEQLMDASIRFEVVPGITAATGASCYAGIPLTHRDHAQSVTFVTGHRRDGQVDLDWLRLTNDTETVVVYMGVQQAATICQQLVLHGRHAQTPVAMVEQATTGKQRVITSTLADLPELISRQGIKPPALMIIGSVVSLREKLCWKT